MTEPDETYAPPVIDLEGEEIPPDSEDWVDVSALGIDPDAIFAIMQPRTPVFWPMILHKHGNSCGRA